MTDATLLGLPCSRPSASATFSRSVHRLWVMMNLTFLHLTFTAFTSVRLSRLVLFIVPLMYINVCQPSPHVRRLSTTFSIQNVPRVTNRYHHYLWPVEIPGSSGWYSIRSIATAASIVPG